MPYAAAGLKQIVMCNKGTLATTPVDPIALGIRKDAVLSINHFKQVEDYRKRKLRNYLNFKLEGETMQPTVFLFKKLLDWINGNFDLQVVTQNQSSSAKDVWKFNAGKELGLDFDWTYNQDGRSCKISFERAFPYNDAVTFIDAADSTTAVSFAGITDDGTDLTIYRGASPDKFEKPAASSLGSFNLVTVRSLNIKTENKKSIDNMSIVDNLMITLEMTGREASISDFVTRLNKGMLDEVIFQEKNSGTYYDKFMFNTNVLSQTDEMVINDDERTLKIVLEGRVPIYSVSFLYGTGNGGDATDTKGTTGGTVKFGY
ncbi:Hypothetical protein IALB_0076 [Ignavibacterium album JCM 16511]|uniref:Uncharacterized protein n=1 Tax=Ignavibacterium album (strain DSM 19864 / JCM 16511 / NBRC 101810 / Mat9-16) TaxID=945713 RepID=I0AFN3_IGNAJ|nr:hypothetical protein [Ignavibacterium album]AFH47790.1 Hypothetical protein IALB_0076 [Ignavibacterium album JCM 16511]